MIRFLYDVLLMAVDFLRNPCKAVKTIRYRLFPARYIGYSQLSTLPDGILVKDDRTAMTNSLKTRIPLLDHRAIKLAARGSITVNTLHTGGEWTLTKILSKYIPEELTEHPEQDFAVPICE